MLIARASCVPVLGVTVEMGGNQCDRFTEEGVARILRIPSIQTVVLSFASAYTSQTLFAADQVVNRAQPAKITSTQFPNRSQEELNPGNNPIGIGQPGVPSQNSAPPFTIR